MNISLRWHCPRLPPAIHERRFRHPAQRPLRHRSLSINSPDGTFGLTTDWWNGHVEKEVGTNFDRLLQLYGVHKASMEARKKGWSVLRKSQPNGSIKLVLATL